MTETAKTSARLSPRLQIVADLVPQCRRVLDIGTDHAWLPIELLRQGRCLEAVAIDIRSGPLAIARRNIQVSGLSDHIAVRLADGLDDLPLTPEDTIVMAGLGGNEMIHILEKQPRIVKAIILQPMKSLPELRIWLCANGYRIETEKLAIEEHRSYAILRCLPGQIPIPISQLESLIGPVLRREQPSGFSIYLKSLLSHLSKRSHGEPELAEMIRQIRQIKEGSERTDE